MELYTYFFNTVPWDWAGSLECCWEYNAQMDKRVLEGHISCLLIRCIKCKTEVGGRKQVYHRVFNRTKAQEEGWGIVTDWGASFWETGSREVQMQSKLHWCFPSVTSCRSLGWVSSTNCCSLSLLFSLYCSDGWSWMNLGMPRSLVCLNILSYNLPWWIPILCNFVITETLHP
jgi:hypothetical protein